MGLRGRLKKLRTHATIAAKNRFLRPDLHRLSSRERVGAAYREPTDMHAVDRIMLYALVRGLRPQRVLEIGVRWGGSARIIANAMEDNGVGRAVGLEPSPEAFCVPERELHGRYTLVAGYSPEATPHAVEALGGPPDFVFIDALHTHDAVLADFHGVLPYLSEGAHVLFHDTFHQGIATAIEEILNAHPEFVDCGILTRDPKVKIPVCAQGLRLLRQGPCAAQALISQAYVGAGLAPVPIMHELRNWDTFGNRIGKGATPQEIAAVRAKLDGHAASD